MQASSRMRQNFRKPHELLYTEHHHVFEKSSRNLCLNSLGPIEKPTACGIYSRRPMNQCQGME